MAFPIAATGVSLVGLPLAAAQTAVVVRDAMKASSSNARLQKWSYRLAEVTAMVDTNSFYIPAKALRKFLALVDRFLRLKTGYEQVLAEGHKDWYGVGKASKNEFRDAARQAWQEGLALSTMANSTKQYCGLQHTNPERNSRGQCIICCPDAISRVSPQNENNDHPPLTWPGFLRSEEAQEIMERDPPTYSESDLGDEATIDPPQLPPRVEINNMWQEFRAIDSEDNEVQAQETEYNPWASSADLKLLNGSV